MKYVKLNSSANIFFDQASKIKIVRGEVVELTDAQYNQRVIQAALNNGYLKDATPDELTSNTSDEIKEIQEVEQTPVNNNGQVNVEDLRGRFIDLAVNGNTSDEIKEKFTLHELKVLAESYDIIPEKGDTKATLVEAILEELGDLELLEEK